MSVKRTQSERREATRAALVDAGRKLFAQRGFSATSTEQLVREAGVTRGALYHHFKDKADLFRAVYEAVEQDLVARVGEAAATASDPLDLLRRGSAAFLDACLEPEVHQVTLIDAPAVLGWEEWKRLDAQYGHGVVKMALQAAMDAGVIPAQPVDTLAHIMLGALTEGALVVGRSPEPARTREEVGQAIERMIAGLAVQNPT